MRGAPRFVQGTFASLLILSGLGGVGLLGSRASATGIVPRAAVTEVGHVTPMCTSSSGLVARMKAGQGAAGTDYRPIVFTNTGGTACLIKGTPGVQPVSGSTHTRIGPASRRNVQAGAGRTIRLAAKKGEAYAIYGMGDQSLPSSCDPHSTDGVIVHLHGVAPMFVALSAGWNQICTKGPNTTSIQGVRAGSGF
jgi:hypothetical protein